MQKNRHLIIGLAFAAAAALAAPIIQAVDHCARAVTVAARWLIGAIFTGSDLPFFKVATQAAARSIGIVAARSYMERMMRRTRPSGSMLWRMTPAT